MVMLVLIEKSHECIQVCAPQKMFFTINKQTRSVENNPVYDAKSSCNCTSNIVILNVYPVYDMSFRIWKYEVLIWTQAVFTIILNISSFKIHRVIFIFSISHLQKLLNYREGWGQIVVVRCSSSERLPVKTHTEL
jgi:hypothetical protein